MAHRKGQRERNDAAEDVDGQEQSVELIDPDEQVDRTHLVALLQKKPADVDPQVGPADKVEGHGGRDQEPEVVAEVEREGQRSVAADQVEDLGSLVIVDESKV